MREDDMRVAVIRRRGGADFSIEQRPRPRPSPGQVVVRVEAASVNFSDVKRRRGDPYPFPTEFPFVPGSEVAGTVSDIGDGVAGLALGTRVLALAGYDGQGGYAQYALCQAQTVVPLPDGLGFDLASTLLVAGTTAQLLLSRATALATGESILVPAAAGGVGSFAVQMARAIGAGQVIAAVGHEDKVALAKANGAHAVVVTRADWPSKVRDLTAGRGVDVALEATGGDELAATLSCLAPFGRLAVFGAASGVSATLDQGAFERWLYAPAANQTVTGFNVGDWFMSRPAIAGQALMSVMSDVASGRLEGPKLTRMPLEAAAEAHLALEQRSTTGKIVLKPWM